MLVRYLAGQTDLILRVEQTHSLAPVQSHLRRWDDESVGREPAFNLEADGTCRNFVYIIASA